ncbi:endonuclease/exonuclease/phosphatase family protein [Telluribacter sp.]|jgi:endonuclease/exonuclease/phosphatase (EEP) superfamily protein YafD|uniref:endonuclease/exonuclease/phosphatase family protein n=1 Tax=Telluribacter sp. TaxID=1978767 RepID=UPI002E168173|nr:endonuclease/exonuclease/phosphatase family protein [Telluribacter sp.]
MLGLGILYAVGVFLLVASTLSLIRADYWIFRVFDYPRLQKWILTAIILFIYPFIVDFNVWYQWAFAGALLLNLAYLSYQMLPFLPFSRIQLLNASRFEKDQTIGIMIANVYQYNTLFDNLLKQIKACDPDIFILSETDQAWSDSMASLHEKYPYRIEEPLDNTYGLMVFSRFELLDQQINYLVEDDVPSIFTKVKLPSGEMIQFYCVHPTPPVPQENPRSTERDKEILIVGKLAKSSPLPVVVAGDLNDVAWSYTTGLFQRISGLLDPRRGRGFFNTFHAKYPLIRFPLDHIFCSPEFRLLEIKRLPYFGSDHFPMWVRLEYEPQGATQQEKPMPEEEDLEVANEKIHEETRDEKQKKST